MPLEDRLDARLAPDADLDVVGLANRWKQTKREREARAFDDVADQIEQGMLRVRGVPAVDVVDRLRTRADNTRAGEDRHHRRRPKPASF